MAREMIATRMGAPASGIHDCLHPAACSMPPPMQGQRVLTYIVARTPADAVGHDLLPRPAWGCSGVRHAIEETGEDSGGELWPATCLSVTAAAPQVTEPVLWTPWAASRVAKTGPSRQVVIRVQKPMSLFRKEAVGSAAR